MEHKNAIDILEQELDNTINELDELYQGLVYYQSILNESTIKIEELIKIKNALELAINNLKGPQQNANF